MKSTRLISKAAIAAATIFLVGQESLVYPQDSHIGVKGGISLAAFRNSSTITNSLKTAFANVNADPYVWWTASLYFSREILKNALSTQMEIMYLRQGEAWELSGEKGKESNEAHFSFHTDYLQIPFLVKILFPVSPALFPYIYIGPDVSFALRSRMTENKALPASLQNSSTFFRSITVSESVFDYARNTIDAGFMTGFGFKIPAGPGAVDIDLRYNFGALNVFNFPAGDKIRNYSFAIMVGYFL
jgi:hypothetical protein